MVSPEPSRAPSSSERASTTSSCLLATQRILKKALQLQLQLVRNTPPEKPARYHTQYTLYRQQLTRSPVQIATPPIECMFRPSLPCEHNIDIDILQLFG
jgi:hypothetical protein